MKPRQVHSFSQYLDFTADCRKMSRSEAAASRPASSCGSGLYPVLQLAHGSQQQWTHQSGRLLSLYCYHTTHPLPCCLQIAQDGEEVRGFHPVAVLLSYLTKAPLVPEGHPLVNALAKQRAALENMFRACVGLPPENNMLLEFK